MKRLLTSALLSFVGVACTAAGGDAAAGVGDPCIPLVEREQTFLGFTEQEISLESGSPSCTTGVCLINHFRGRVSCPYGQAADGSAPSGAAVCRTPSGGAPVTGSGDPRRQATVPPQCLDRTADRAVYCSCRCANGAGRTDDGQSYCACPNGYECAGGVTSIGPSTDGVAGSYCVKRGTVYNPDTACSQGDCDPVGKKCG